MWTWAALILLFASPQVYVAEVQGVINPVTAEFMERVMDQAEKDRVDLLVFTLDTPGGLDESMRIIVKRLLATRIPVCVYVYPPGARAASAGAFITLAAPIAAMAPGTNIGAAHPVAIGAGGEMDTVMAEKVLNDAVAYIKSIARKRGRNEEWAERAVRESESATAKEALELGVIDLVAENLEDLLEKLDGDTVRLNGEERILKLDNPEIRRIRMGVRERILAVIANPTVAYLLLIIGFYGLIFELSNPGSILPGVLGAIALFLALYSFQVLPVNYAGVLLIILAMILFFAEVKIQSHGMLGVGGAIALILGSLMLFETGSPFFRISWSAIGVVVALTVLFFFFVIAKAVQAQRRKPVTGVEGLVGEVGVARTRITPEREGTVLVHGELWVARSSLPIEKGEEVRVVKIEGLRLYVEPLHRKEVEA